jgi:hypothetical protein
MNNAELGAAVRALFGGTTPTGDLAAYELPALTEAEVPLEKCDSNYIFPDGSSWATQHGGAFNRGNGVEQGPDSTQKVPLYFGYWSRAKFGTDLWAQMAALYGADRWAVFEADLAARPYQRFKLDPRPYVLAEDPVTKKRVANQVTFSAQYVQSFGEGVPSEGS